jgi:methenyltetrahydromethanopterin cyclohydrolase
MLTLRAPEIKDYLDRIPSNKSKGYGKPFYETFKEANFDFTRSTPPSSARPRS